MNCHICQAEAVTRCYNCGELVCEEHGKSAACARCNTGIVSGDPRADRVSATPIATEKPNPWWRPQEAEEYHPPACYECQGLSRTICRNCHGNYCRDHAGPNGLCLVCGRSARLGTYVFLGVVAAMGLLFLINWLAG